jgi:hypothetical protein
MKKYKDKQNKKIKSEIYRVLMEEGRPLNHKQIRKKITIKGQNKLDFLSFLQSLVSEKKLLVNEDFKFYFKKSD